MNNVSARDNRRKVEGYLNPSINDRKCALSRKSPLGGLEKLSGHAQGRSVGGCVGVAPCPKARLRDLWYQSQRGSGKAAMQVQIGTHRR